jgi:AAA family ATP:ADP antiporter
MEDRRAGRDIVLGHAMTEARESAAPDEAGRRGAFVALGILVMAAAFVMLRTGRDALYFQRDGLLDLPKAYIGIAVLSVPFAFGTLGLMRLLGPRAARVAAPLAVAAVFWLAAAHATPGGGIYNSVLFMLVPLAFGVLFSLGWLLAADLLDGASADTLARAYGGIGAGAIVGGVAGGALGRVLATRLEPQELMQLGAALLGASALVMLAAQLRYPPHPLTAEAGPASVAEAGRRGDPWRVLAEPYGLLLLAAAATGSLVGIFVEFQFYVAAATSGASARESARFFASFYLALNAAALGVQLYLMPRVQRWLGVHRSLLIMPAAVMGMAALLVANTSLLVRSGLRVTEGGLKASIHRANWEQAFLPLPARERHAAKVAIDGGAARIAEGIAAGCLYVWLVVVVGDRPLVGQSASWLTYLILVAGLGWLVSLRALGRAAAARGVDLKASPRLDLPLPDT